ncbi:hypothetical protein JSO54_10235 [Riemerella anatipestifer]|uniref:hypothetical protein n=1 Tax=Riemerella anatipestifer TaxID=34085 RepID=UPI0030BB8729
MKTRWTQQEINEYQNIFDLVNSFIGKGINHLIFYLDEEDIDFNEQENIYGKSLLNGIEIICNNEKYYLGNLFFGNNYNGLNIRKGNHTDYESVENKKPTNYPSKILNETIIDAKIYWHRSFIGKYFVPIEITFETNTRFILFSSIEVNFGEVNTELTDELLVIEDKLIAEKLHLGEFGIENNGRKLFKNINEIMEAEKNIA